MVEFWTIDPRTGRVSLDSKHRGLEDFDVIGFLRGRFGRMLRSRTTLNLAMLGEQRSGAPSRCHNAAFLALGTGAGLGLLLDANSYVSGASGSAGEIADLPIGHDPDFADTISLGPAAHSSSRWVTRHRGSIPAPGWNRGFAKVRDIFGSSSKETKWRRRSRHDGAWVALPVVNAIAPRSGAYRGSGESIGVRPELYERVPTALPILFSDPLPSLPSGLRERAGPHCAAWAAGPDPASEP